MCARKALSQLTRKVWPTRRQHSVGSVQSDPCSVAHHSRTGQDISCLRLFGPIQPLRAHLQVDRTNELSGPTPYCFSSSHCLRLSSIACYWLRIHSSSSLVMKLNATVPQTLLLALVFALSVSSCFSLQIWLSSGASRVFNQHNVALCTPLSPCRSSSSQPLPIPAGYDVHIDRCEHEEGIKLNALGSTLRVVFTRECTDDYKLGTLIGQTIIVENLRVDELRLGSAKVNASLFVAKNWRSEDGPWDSPVGTISEMRFENCYFEDGMAIRNTVYSKIHNIVVQDTVFDGVFIADSYGGIIPTKISLDNVNCSDSDCQLHLKAHTLAISHSRWIGGSSDSWNLLCFSNCSFSDSTFSAAGTRLNMNTVGLQSFTVTRSSFQKFVFTAYDLFDKHPSLRGSLWWTDFTVNNASIVDSRFTDSSIAIKGLERIVISNSVFTSTSSWPPLILSGARIQFSATNTITYSASSSRCALCLFDNVTRVEGSLQSIGSIGAVSRYARSIMVINGNISAQRWIGSPSTFSNRAAVIISGSSATLALSSSYDGRNVQMNVRNGATMRIMATNSSMLLVSAATVAQSVVIESSGYLLPSSLPPLGSQVTLANNSSAFKVARFSDMGPAQNMTVEYSTLPSGALAVRTTSSKCRSYENNHCLCLNSGIEGLECGDVALWVASNTLRLDRSQNLVIPSNYRVEVAGDLNNAGSIMADDNTTISLDGHFVNSGILTLSSTFGLSTSISNGARRSIYGAEYSAEEQECPLELSSQLFASDLNLTEMSEIHLNIDASQLLKDPNLTSSCFNIAPIAFFNLSSFRGRLSTSVTISDWGSNFTIPLIATLSSSRKGEGIVASNFSTTSKITIGSTTAPSSCSYITTTPGLISLTVLPCSDRNGSKGGPHVHWYYWAIPVVVVAVVMIAVAVIILSVPKLRHSVTPWRDARM